jgi:hypothetical protein
VRGGPRGRARCRRRTGSGGPTSSGDESLPYARTSPCAWLSASAWREACPETGCRAPLGARRHGRRAHERAEPRRRSVRVAVRHLVYVDPLGIATRRRRFIVPARVWPM